LLAISRANYPKPMRRVLALVEVDGQQREMEFLTNKLSWSAGSVADLYRCRWQVEVFFQTNQAELAVVRFPGQQRQRGPLARLDGAVALRPDAFSVRDEQLKSLFYESLEAATSRALEKN
jgi:hypothetical protein